MPETQSRANDGYEAKRDAPDAYPPSHFYLGNARIFGYEVPPTHSGLLPRETVCSISGYTIGRPSTE